MAIFHNNKAIFFSLSQKLEKNQLPYVFLINRKTNMIIRLFSTPATAIGILNLLFSIIYTFFIKFRHREINDRMMVTFSAIALFVFFTFFILFIFIRKTSLIISSNNIISDEITLSKFESFSIYSGCFSSISTAILCICALGINLNFSSPDNIILSFLKLITLFIFLSMNAFCLSMLKSFLS